MKLNLLIFPFYMFIISFFICLLLLKYTMFFRSEKNVLTRFWQWKGIQ